jgi:hypothetical protein
MTTATEPERVATTVPLDWREVWFTNCPMVSANNIDQELGWCREEYKKIGVEYAYFRHSPENNWYPHYTHNLDNLVRFGSLYPPIHVHADIRRTVLLGATWVHEVGQFVNQTLFQSNGTVVATRSGSVAVVMVSRLLGVAPPARRDGHDTLLVYVRDAMPTAEATVECGGVSPG